MFFLIRRKLELMNTVEPYNKVFRIGKMEYQGLERSHLYDLREVYYNNTIPGELKAIIEKNLEEACCR